MSDFRPAVHGHNLEDTELGKSTEYVSQYMPSLLCPISRKQTRESLGWSEASQLPFSGMDIWTTYELSWINSKGLPQVALAEFFVPASSPNIIESKSFKLYLNSLNQTVFNNVEDVIKTIESDLSSAAQAPVLTTISPLSQITSAGLGHFTGICLDSLDIEVNEYHPSPDLLRHVDSETIITESLYSDLLKTNCPVTGQPDWASIFIYYRGRGIDHESLLKYLVSFREHQDFHEHCVERIFHDLTQHCDVQALRVYARYTRRGGLDINPYRCNDNSQPEDIRLIRQ